MSEFSFVTKEPINEGWSSDKKYCVTGEDGTRYLLRVSDIAQYDAKQYEFNMMKKVASLCWALSFGQDEINTMLNQAKDILAWYDNMRNPIPTWYFKDYYLQFREEWEASDGKQLYPKCT